MQALAKIVRGKSTVLIVLSLVVGMMAGCGGKSSSSSGSNVTATPTLNPGAGTYSTSQTVTISDTTAGAVLYCTTDGTTPTTSSPKCAQPTTVYKTEFLQAIATAPGMTASAVASAGYTINANAAPTPTFNPTGGTYTGAQQVTISDSLSGANIYYTLDGSTPTASSTLYTGAITIAQSETLNAIAMATGYANSGMASAAYTIQGAVAAPTIGSLSPASATVGGAAFTLTVKGTNFDSGTTVKWGATSLTTAYVSATQLTAAVPANLIASAGSVVISVITSAGGSAYGAFAVYPYSTLPAITSFSPSSATAGGAGFTLTVNGSNFDSSAVVTWNSTSLATSYVNANKVTAAVPASLIASTGTASITVATTAGESSASSFTVQAAAPTITGISPTSATVGGSGFLLTVSGTSFDASAKINWNGATLATALINPTTVTANIPASLITSVDTANISVTTNAGGSGVSTFTIQLGAPTITGLNPTSVTVGGSTFTLTVNGTNFDSSAVVKWNGGALGTTLVSASQLTASVPANLITSTGTANITVTTTVGTTSTASTLAIQPAGVPTIGFLDPSTATAGGSAFLLTVNGTGFDSSSVIKWNSTALTTIYVDSTKLQATISADMLASGGTVPVTVSGTGGPSAPSSFIIKLGVPTITGFVPTSASSNDPTFTSLTVNGTNFDASAAVYWNDGTTNTQLNTTYKNAGQVTAVVPASLIALPVTPSITVQTTAGTSAPSNFTINLGPPTISSTDPPSATAGGASFTLKVTGTNFDPSAKIKWNGAVQPTTLMSPTEVDASIDRSLIASSSSATITVTNSTGGSNNFPFSINVPAPIITGLSATSGPVGSAVTIEGKNFGATGGTVDFGGTQATVASGNWTDGAIKTTVPTGLSTGDVTVTVATANNQTATYTFTVTAPLSAIGGTVVSGPGASGLPIIGASVQLYAAGITGYGSTNGSALGSATTGTDGSFNLSYQCPAASAGDQLYLIATGGGITSSTNNGGLAMMTVLGSCNASTFPTSSVLINEVSTVASAYALAQFSVPDTTNGHGIVIGTSAGNVTGLSNAMMTVDNLYNSGTGMALSITPKYAAFASSDPNDSAENLNSSYVPQMRIHTLANILNGCVSSNGSGCDGLLTNTSTADTLQAILNIALNPGTNVSTLYDLQPSSQAFTPALYSAPTDWTMALTYTGGGLGAPPAQAEGNGSYPPTLGSMAIDADGGIWMMAKGCLSGNQEFIAKFDNQGNAISDPATSANSYCGGLQPTLKGSPVLNSDGARPFGIAIDTDGSVWVAVGRSATAVTKLDSSGNALDAYVGVGGYNACWDIYGMAIDATGHLWTGGGSGTPSECFGAINTADGSSVDDNISDWVVNGDLSPFGGRINSVVVDPSGVVWSVAGTDDGTTSAGTGNIFKSTQISDTKVSTTTISGAGNTSTFSIAVDAAGNLYAPSATPGTITKATAGAASFSTLSYLVPSGAAGVQALAVDGAGHLWGASYGGPVNNGSSSNPVTVPSYLVEYDESGKLLSPSDSSTSVYGYIGAGGGGETHPILADYTYLSPIVGVAADSSGNLWVANGGLYDNTAQANELVEFVGLAAPVRTPIAAAVNNNEIGVLPQVRSSQQATSMTSGRVR